MSSVAAVAVVSAVALTGCSAKAESAMPPAEPLAAAAPPETVVTTSRGPAEGGAANPGGPGTPAVGPAGAVSAPRPQSAGRPEAAAAEGGATDADTHGTRTIAPCATEALAVSSQKEPADAAETRHILITVQNAGGTTCDIFRHPYVLLGNAQAPAPVIEESDPDPGVPVTLAPGDEAYAAMVLNGPMDEYEVTGISLTLQGSAPGSTAGGPIDVPMPGAAPLYANDFQRVTYWTTAPGFALDFVMSK
ncbi:DUF4232 domain-containing protein [Yinghuangia sp. ASG 101]|uniref:DUF4232 domain-containing protein n=1 Tax=Yinghuangia sp. ASG 101 TaxID=2896848 RepID=UPI001E4EFE5B|nr:DUF4232 domain-containing protein [Yinghuangia sp. ASG 101]UGQ11339.1 DUF4232 domain-containing protein [Yinghuangia sp. ASG 101]